MEATWWTKPEDLDEDQKAVIALDKDGNHLVCGPPGCGKTNLLLLRAGYMHTIKRRNFVVLTYGRVLKEFLATGAVHYPFDSGRISTYAAWATKLSVQYGLPVPVGVDEPTSRALLLENMHAILAKADGFKFDCLLVDEVQDYAPAEIDVFMAISKQSFFVGDSRQEIYGSKEGLEYLKTKVPMKTLTAHYRNGLKICRVADAIFDECDQAHGLEATSQYNEAAYPSTVVANGGLDIGAQAKLAGDEIVNQLVAYPTGYIGVMCPRNVDLDAVAAAMAGEPVGKHIQVQKSSEGYTALVPDKRVVLTTLHGAKGMEFRAVHLLSADHITCFREQTRRVSYTSVTRAKTYLGIYSDQALPGFLDQAIAMAEHAPSPEPSLAQLFIKG